MTGSRRRLAVPMILMGVAGLLASRHLEGPMRPFLRAHGANLSFSFGATFMIWLFLPGRPVLAAVAALLGLTAQEISQGLGWYPGVFDVYDLLWNALGVTVALVVLLLLRGASRGRDSSDDPRARSRRSP